MRRGIDFALVSDLQSPAIEIATMVTPNSILRISHAVEDHKRNTCMSS